MILRTIPYRKQKTLIFGKRTSRGGDLPNVGVFYVYLVSNGMSRKKI